MQYIETIETRLILSKPRQSIETRVGSVARYHLSLRCTFVLYSSFAMNQGERYQKAPFLNIIAPMISIERTLEKNGNMDQIVVSLLNTTICLEFETCRIINVLCRHQREIVRFAYVFSVKRIKMNERFISSLE